MRELIEDMRRLSGLDPLAEAKAKAGGPPVVVSPDAYLITDSGEYVWTPERVKKAWKDSYAALKRLADDPKYNKLVLMVGVPGAGKSTWIQKNKEPGAIYFDATFTDQRSRRPVIKMGNDGGMDVEAVMMTTPINVCKDRNACRTADRKVPDDVVEKMATRLIGDLPQESEGFSKIRHAQ